MFRFSSQTNVGEYAVKNMGLMICVIGSIAALVYPPYSILGNTQWGFIWSSLVSAFGKGVYVYEHLDYLILGFELALINVIGLAVKFRLGR